MLPLHQCEPLFLKLRFSHFQKGRDAFPGGLGAGDFAEAYGADYKGLAQVFGGHTFLNRPGGDGDRLPAQLSIRFTDEGQGFINGIEGQA